MFTIKELNYIKEAFENMDDSKVSKEIQNKIATKVEQINGYDKILWSFYWDCGRMGDVEGVFKATQEEVKNAIGKQVYFGEILGKHSEVYGEFEECDVEIMSDDPLAVIDAVESGYNPLEYLRYECSECGDAYEIDDFNTETDLCVLCEKEQG